MEKKSKICNYVLSNESINLIEEASKKLGLKKASLVDALIKRYTNHLVIEISEKLERYEKETMNNE